MPNVHVSLNVPRHLDRIHSSKDGRLRRRTLAVAGRTEAKPMTSAA
jgi:hypothetical protein